MALLFAIALFDVTLVFADENTVWLTLTVVAKPKDNARTVM